MAEFLESLDVFALSSLAEGLPRVLLEAMAAGLPVVTTDCEGVGNISGLRECGTIVSKGDPPAIARAITELLDDADERSRRGRLAVEHVRRAHSIDRVCRDVVEEYRRIANGTGRK